MINVGKWDVVDTFSSRLKNISKKFAVYLMQIKTLIFSLYPRQNQYLQRLGFAWASLSYFTNQGKHYARRL